MIVTEIPTQNDFYQKTYDLDYIKGPTTLGMKLADAWPAACYAHGIFEVPVMFNMQEQIDYLARHRNILPKNVLEIGSGQGELSCAFSFLGYNVDSVECNPSAQHFHRATYRRFFNRYPPDTYRLFVSDLRSYLPYFTETIDTILLVESIEHIEKSEWNEFFDFVLPTIKKNHARLIITNQKNYWPLGFKGDALEHISLIDDDFYDRLSSNAFRVQYRDFSHLCLQF